MQFFSASLALGSGAVALVDLPHIVQNTVVNLSNMSSHPGQAGKFRPNKPQPKSVIPPGVTSNAAVPEINKKPHDSGLNKYPTSHGKRTGPTQSSNRFVIPKGQVFFTGGSAAQSNGDKKKASSSSSKGSRGPSSARSIIVPGGQ